MKPKQLTFLLLLIVHSAISQNIQVIETSEIVSLLNSDKKLAHAIINTYNLFKIDTIVGIQLLEQATLNNNSNKDKTVLSKLKLDSQTYNCEPNDSSLYNALDPLISKNSNYIQLNNEYSSVSDIVPEDEKELNYYLSSYYGNSGTIQLLCNGNKGYFKMNRTLSPLNGYGVIWLVELKDKSKLFVELISTIKS